VALNCNDRVIAVVNRCLYRLRACTVRLFERAKVIFTGLVGTNFTRFFYHFNLNAGAFVILQSIPLCTQNMRRISHKAYSHHSCDEQWPASSRASRFPNRNWLWNGKNVYTKQLKGPSLALGIYGVAHSLRR